VTPQVVLALAKSLHAHQLCCGMPLESCPVRRDLILEARLVKQDLGRLGYRLARKKVAA
jgi:hypothetical protein